MSLLMSSSESELSIQQHGPHLRSKGPKLGERPYHSVGSMGATCAHGTHRPGDPAALPDLLSKPPPHHVIGILCPCGPTCLRAHFPPPGTGFLCPDVSLHSWLSLGHASFRKAPVFSKLHAPVIPTSHSITADWGGLCTSVSS